MAAERRCACPCLRLLPPHSGPGRPQKWYSDACRKRGRAQGMAPWAQGLSVKDIERVERKVVEVEVAGLELLGLVRNRRPGDTDRRRELVCDSDHAGTWGAWDDTCVVWQAAKLGVVDRLMAEAERRVRPIEYLRPPTPVRVYEMDDQAEVVSLDVVRDDELREAA